MGSQSSVAYRDVHQNCTKVPETKDDSHGRACHIDASHGDVCPVDINPSPKCNNDFLLGAGSVGRLVMLKRQLGDSFGVDVEIKRRMPARVFILKTQPGGAAERVNLFPGDEIVAVNGIAVTTFDYREACNYFQGLKQHTEIQLSISDTGSEGKIPSPRDPGTNGIPKEDTFLGRGHREQMLVIPRSYVKDCPQVMPKTEELQQDFLPPPKEISSDFEDFGENEELHDGKGVMEGTKRKRSIEERKYIYNALEGTENRQKMCEIDRNRDFDENIEKDEEKEGKQSIGFTASLGDRAAESVEIERSEEIVKFSKGHESLETDSGQERKAQEQWTNDKVLTKDYIAEGSKMEACALSKGKTIGGFRDNFFGIEEGRENDYYDENHKYECWAEKDSIKKEWKDAFAVNDGGMESMNEAKPEGNVVEERTHHAFDNVKSLCCDGESGLVTASATPNLSSVLYPPSSALSMYASAWDSETGSTDEFSSESSEILEVFNLVEEDSGPLAIISNERCAAIDDPNNLVKDGAQETQEYSFVPALHCRQDILSNRSVTGAPLCNLFFEDSATRPVVQKISKNSSMVMSSDYNQQVEKQSALDEESTGAVNVPALSDSESEPEVFVTVLPRESTELQQDIDTEGNNMKNDFIGPVALKSENPQNMKGYSTSFLLHLSQCPSASSSDFFDHQLKLSSDLISISSTNPLPSKPVTPVWPEPSQPYSKPHSTIVSQPLMPAQVLGSLGQEMKMSDDLISVNIDVEEQNKNRVKEQSGVEERLMECEMDIFSGLGMTVVVDGEKQTDRENDDMNYLENLQRQNDNKVHLEDEKGNQMEAWKGENTKHKENMNKENWRDNEEECTRASKCKNWKIGEKGERKDVETTTSEDTAMEELQKDANDNKLTMFCRKISSDSDTHSSGPSLPSSAAPSLPPSPPPLSDNSNVENDQLLASSDDQWFISPLVFGSLQTSPQLPPLISAEPTEVQDSEFSEKIAKEIVNDEVKLVMMEGSGQHNNFKVVKGRTSGNTIGIACEERDVDDEKVNCWSKCVKEDVSCAEYHSTPLAFADGEPLATPAIIHDANNSTKQQTDLLPADSGVTLAEVKNSKSKADYDDSNLVSVQALIQSFEALPRHKDSDQSRKTHRKRQGVSWPSWRPQSHESLSTLTNSFEAKSQLHLWPNSTMDVGYWADAGHTEKFLNQPNVSFQFSKPLMFNQVEALRENRFHSLVSDPTDIHVVAKDNDVLKEPVEVQVKGDQNNDDITPSVGHDKCPGKLRPSCKGHEIEMRNPNGRGSRWSAVFEVEAETEALGGGKSEVVVEESWSVSLEELSSYAAGKGPRARLANLLPECDLTSLLEQLQVHEAFWESCFVVLKKEEGMDLGFSITGGSDMEMPYVTVHRVFPGGVAEREGSIHHGQRLLWMNGQWLWAVSHSSALRSLHKARTSPHALLVLAKDHEQKVIEPASEKWSKCAGTGPLVTVSLPAGTSGLGFSINGGRDSVLGDTPLTIHHLFKGGAAEQSGCISVGDELLTLGNRDLQGLTRFQAWRLLRAVPEGPVSLVIRKPPAF
uniref:uncharacterized protein n=1 Tax=Myxine glutinosa TaxID=7769 RepID=UPI00358FBA7E